MLVCKPPLPLEKIKLCASTDGLRRVYVGTWVYVGYTWGLGLTIRRELGLDLDYAGIYQYNIYAGIRTSTINELN